MMWRGWQGWVLLAVALSFSDRAAAQAPDRGHREPAIAADSPALVLGYGVHYGGVGLAATYARPVLAWLRLTARLGAGFLIGMSDGTSPFGWAGGLGMVVGTGHRAFLDVGWARGGVESVYLHGTLAGARGVSGPTGSVGYEYVSLSGFVVRLGLDLFARMHPNSTLRDGTWQKSIGVGVGKELW